LLFLLAVLFLVTGYFAYDHAKSYILIQQYLQTTTICRGEPADHVATKEACNQRQIIVNKLLSQGYCFGRNDQAEYQKFWAKCK